MLMTLQCNDEIAVNKDLERLYEWSSELKLELNPGRTNTAFFTTNRHNFKYTLKIDGNSVQLKKESNSVYLGIKLNTELRYIYHTWRRRAERSSMSCEASLDKLDKIQYAAGRIMTSATRSTSTDYVKHEAELIPLNKRRDEIMLKGSGLKRLPKGHMNHDLITKWQKISRLKRLSPLELYSDLVTRYEFNKVLQDLTVSHRSPHKYQPWVTTGIPDIHLTLK